jgi:hypothetical protein
LKQGAVKNAKNRQQQNATEFRRLTLVRNTMQNFLKEIATNSEKFT